MGHFGPEEGFFGFLEGLFVFFGGIAHIELHRSNRRGAAGGRPTRKMTFSGAAVEKENRDWGPGKRMKERWKKIGGRRRREENNEGVYFPRDEI